MSGLRPTPTGQRGVALVAALFLIVVLALLGSVAARLVNVQSHSVSLNLLSARALQAAQSGIEVAAYRALNGGCTAGSLSFGEGGLNGFLVDTGCVASTHSEGGSVTTVYQLQAFARTGVYGGPDYVSRRVSATITDSL